jgi:predicted enzyme related to lactoylglutathione lyase
MSTNHQPDLGNGKICYLVIPAVDISQSATFYETVFEWRVRKRDDGSIAFDDGVGQVSGTWVTGLPPHTHFGVLIYIMVTDINITMKLIEENGGKITKTVGKDYPEITAEFEDPAGNLFGLYQEPSMA